MPTRGKARRRPSGLLPLVLAASLAGAGPAAHAASPAGVRGWQQAWTQRLQSWRRQIEAMATPRPTRPLGVSFVTETRPFVPHAQVGTLPEGVVLLVHGLDEPGYIWDDLIPVLLDAGHAVARFEYPNDGAIADAADLLARELAALQRRGVRRVEIVAHSMGGLVSRDLLSRREHYDGDGSGGPGRPSIDRLVMVGTPNHGSEWARMRGMSEIKERVYRMVTSDDGVLLDFEADGDGQAARDLLPGSAFLRDLNARPTPSHTCMTIVAGRVVPPGDDELDALREQISKLSANGSTPAWLRRWLAEDPAGAVEGWLDGLASGVGDGVVTVESATWTPVEDFTVVEANHLSLLFVPGANHRLPPAIPIVLDRLGSP